MHGVGTAGGDLVVVGQAFSMKIETTLRLLILLALLIGHEWIWALIFVVATKDA